MGMVAALHVTVVNHQVHAIKSIHNPTLASRLKMNAKGKENTRLAFL